MANNLIDPNSWFDLAVDVFGPGVLSWLQSNNTKQGSQESVRLLQDFLNTSMQMIEDTRIEADFLIQQGETAAAADLIQYTTEGVDEIWKGANLGAESIDRFMGKARSTLMPTIEQGGYASDEQARMLGIKDSSGKKHEFDPSIIEDTPGFKFRQEWGQRGVENSAVGRQLSGQSARELTEFNQGLAGTYFDKRFDQLGSMAERGDRGATTLANLYAGAGSATAGLYGNAGINAGSSLSSLGANLGNLRVGSAGQRAGLLTNTASTLTNLGLAGITGANQGIADTTNATNGFLNDLAIAMGASGTFGNSQTGSNGGTPNYTIAGGFQPTAPVAAPSAMTGFTNRYDYGDFDEGLG